MGNGGRRPGAGRKPGTPNVLPTGTVAALDAARIAQKRLGKDADPADLAVLQHVYSRVADVLAEKVDFRQAGHVLKGSAMVADAVAGPIVQKVQASGADGGPLTVLIRDLGKEPEPQEE